MVRKIFKAQMQICTPPYFSPECRQPTSPYDNYTEPYSNNNMSDPQSDVLQNFHASNVQGQSYGLPTFQIPIHDQRWSGNDSYTSNTNTFDMVNTFTSWPHCTIPIPSTPSSSPQYSFPGSNDPMEAIHIELNYNPGNYPAISAPSDMSSPFYAGPEGYAQGSTVMPLPGVSFYNFQSTTTAPNPQSPPLSTLPSPTIMPRAMDYPSTPIATKPEGFRDRRSSSTSTGSSIHRASPYRRVRRPQKEKLGDRPFKCEVSGCRKDFDRSYNHKQHKETHRSDRVKAFKCRVPGCSYRQQGFIRKHDLDRHKNTHLTTEEKNLFRCPLCGKRFSRRDTLQR
jgi:hypothetical protein